MFDEQEQKLLGEALLRVRKDYRNHSNVYEVSGFDQNFDEELRKLVILYGFDFQAIALHLYFKFPQYSFRMKPQAVSYRWYQLTLQQEGPRIKQELSSLEQKPKGAHHLEMKEEEEQTEEVVICSLEEKRAQYEAALKMAAFLDEEEEQAFMVYKPKFIIDSEFKLEREKSENTLMISSMVQNQLRFEFGPFESVCAAPIDLKQFQQAYPQSQPMVDKEQGEQQYLDDDWQAYESD